MKLFNDLKIIKCSKRIDKIIKNQNLSFLNGEKFDKKVKKAKKKCIGDENCENLNEYFK